jgi:inhibitor of KinA
MGDQGYLGEFASEALATAFAAAVRQVRWSWLADVVVAYRHVAVFFQTPGLVPPSALDDLLSLSSQAPPAPVTTGRDFSVPCWYDPASDLPAAAQHLGLPVAEVIRLHSGRWYTVYAIGFVPGFPYLGYLPVELQGLPRLAKPRPRVPAGSVAIAGKQTGIYPAATPGGWWILGRTPCLLVDIAAGYFPLRPGDRVQFLPIDEQEYQRRLGERLPV